MPIGTLDPLGLSNAIKSILNSVQIPDHSFSPLLGEIYSFVNKQIQAEREACAQIADSIKDQRISDSDEVSNEIAKRIRERND